MEHNQPPSAHAGDSAQPFRPRRLWDEARQCWYEAACNVRNVLGQFAKHIGVEPAVQFQQMKLPYKDEAA